MSCFMEHDAATWLCGEYYEHRNFVASEPTTTNAFQQSAGAVTSSVCSHGDASRYHTAIGDPDVLGRDAMEGVGCQPAVTNRTHLRMTDGSASPVTAAIGCW